MRLKQLIACAITALCAGPLSASELTLSLQDEDGNPVSMAVVEARLAPADVQTSAPVAIVDQVNRQFVPMVLRINPGQQVSFPNSDNVRHHVYSFSDIKQFSTPLYADENVEPVQFDTPGIAVLGCNIHDSMVAYVYVSAWQDTALSDDTGQVTLTGMAEQPPALYIWHPWLQTPDNVYELDVSAHADGDRIELTLPVVNPEQQFGFRALLPGGSQ
ncbi:MAG: methylamine utilization protein [Pseudohongiella sp.]|uniref:methylamine utilization protein n=1 Tax=Pseudohongiella sp. TaxID=1979412 RepID=UPI0034A07D55